VKAVGHCVDCLRDFHKHLLLLCGPCENFVKSKRFVAFATVAIFCDGNCISSDFDAAFEACVIRPHSHNNAEVAARAHQGATAVCRWPFSDDRIAVSAAQNCSASAFPRSLHLLPPQRRSSQQQPPSPLQPAPCSKRQILRLLTCDTTVAVCDA